MTDNIIQIDFHKPDSRWLKKAHAARENGDVEKAARLYRNAVEQSPGDFDMGLCYALYLWEIGCWHASLRECTRLLAMWPEEEKVYGLLYRDCLCLGQEDNARFAYEKYMMHLYRNPEGGLNLNEEDPPIPDAPPKRRFKHLLLRVARLLDQGDYDQAGHLLIHANHPTFPERNVLREMLVAQLMSKTGFEEEARQIVYAMVDGEELNASQAVALMPMMCELGDAQYAGRLLIYAATVARNPVEVHDATATALSIGQPKLALSMQENLLDLEPYRVDVLYQMAVCLLHTDQMQAALQTIQKCHRLDPCDSDVDYLYRLLMANSGATCQEILKMPVPLFGEAVSLGRTMMRMHMKELLDADDLKTVAEQLTQWPEQTRVMDCLSHMTEELVFALLKAVRLMEEEQREAFLRRMLLCGELGQQEEDEVFRMLAQLGVSGPLPVLRGAHLKERMLEEASEPFEDE